MRIPLRAHRSVRAHTKRIDGERQRERPVESEVYAGFVAAKLEGRAARVVVLFDTLSASA